MNDQVNRKNIIIATGAVIIAMFFLLTYDDLGITGVGGGVKEVERQEMVYVVGENAENLVSNSSFEDGEGSGAVGWQESGLGYTRLTTEAHTGTSSAFFESTVSSNAYGVSQTIILNQEVPTPVFVGGYIKGEEVVVAPNGYFGVRLHVAITLQDGRVIEHNSRRNNGTFDWRRVGFNTNHIPAVKNQPISSIRVSVLLDRGTGRVWSDDIEVVEISENEGALVTIMFDDGEENVFLNAAPILFEHDLQASVPVISGRVGQGIYMNEAQIKELVSAGWEMVSHGITHTDLSTLTQEEWQEELEGSKETLERITGYTVYNLAFPFGGYTDDVLGDAQRTYASARAYEIGNNPSGIFPFDVKIRSIENTTSMEQIEEWLTQAEAENEWAILTFHSVVESPEQRYDSTPALLQEIVGYLIENDIETATYDEGVRRYGVFSANN